MVKLKLEFENALNTNKSLKELYIELLSKHNDLFHKDINDSLVDKIHKAKKLIQTHKLVSHEPLNNMEIKSSHVNFLCYENLLSDGYYKNIKINFSSIKKVRQSYNNFIGSLMILTAEEVDEKKNIIYNNCEYLLAYVGNVYELLKAYSQFGKSYNGYIDRIVLFMDICGIVQTVLRTSEEIFTNFLPPNDSGGIHKEVQHDSK